MRTTSLQGTVHLRHLRVKDSSLFAFLKSPHFAKKRLIEPILKQFPKRKFIFVGDSGEKGMRAVHLC
jgi:phosphatidate phosphatase APP1